MNILRLLTSVAGGSKPDRDFNHHIAPESEIDFFDTIKAVARKKIETYKAAANGTSDQLREAYGQGSVIESVSQCV